MKAETRDKLVKAFEQHPKPNIQFSYGTAGFRTKADHLDGVMFSVGCLAALRAYKLKHKVGVMITASHNPEEDNGVKVVDPEGDMLEMKWEKYATLLANASSANHFVEELGKLIEAENIDIEGSPSVFVGRDTRSSSLKFSQSVSEGIHIFGLPVIDLGLVTTPQLHFAVRQSNKNLPYNEEAYFKTLLDAFFKILGDGVKPNKLIVDASNGIGGLKAEILQPKLASALQIDLRNKEGPLNHEVGADYVKSKQRHPKGVDPSADLGQRVASLDGDADRLIYSYFSSEGQGSPTFHLLDGDKIAALIALFVKEELEIVGLRKDIRIGVVQTAYANGASTKFLVENLGVEVGMVKTGVKYLHKKAKEYDVGVYFEANGHGTVLFSDKYQKLLADASGSTQADPRKKLAFERLQVLPSLINQAVGDALSDLLVVEAILLIKGWGAVEWEKNLYSDLPNVLQAVRVADRRKVTTNEEETRALSPTGLQEEIDQLVSHVKGGRSFVRPSGTEDVVRVYAEGLVRDDVIRLANSVAETVVKFVGKP
eukprot:TRINITY_DN1150_c0_g1_i1.p1 TRINITY_DN1150_c0_g1~~TRINITY_DN1150_c0_g1_i1.p1  ORF type:complete len:549 (-),score=163.93 TRINITY_DN1150_c0_g1_i1:42-1661(-)